MSDRCDEIAATLNEVAIEVYKLRQTVDPGHTLMIRYLRRMETKLDRMKNDFRRRVAQESGAELNGQ
jgi:hypothetical protein